GGVSSWIAQIISALPDIRFAVVFLGSRPEDYGEPKYELPPNLVHLETHYLHDPADSPPHRRPPALRGDAELFADVHALHQAFAGGEGGDLSAFARLSRELQPGGRLTLAQFLHSEAAWEEITSRYREHCSDPSFVDYFWTVRNMHQPLWKLGRIAAGLLPVKVYHAASTGHAGFLGAMLTHATGRPLILSEHGIYTKERKIDLFQSQWIREQRNPLQRDLTEMPYVLQIWIRFFEWLGRLTYEAADPIVSLYEANRQRQIADGAEASRTRCIPNGVSIARLAPLRGQRPRAVPPVLCLIGRVVPIKDVKNFIRAMRRVVNRMPEAEGWIAGPQDEDPVYAEECRQLAASLGLADKVKFLGFREVDELLPQIGLVVLSSISEALPLVVLEGFAAGVPAVTTDVGACRQLLFGLGAEDVALGAAGQVVGIADPQALADAAIGLLKDASAWQAAQRAGIRRVERYYSDHKVFAHYRAIYEHALGRQNAARDADTVLRCPMGHGGGVSSI
ncbi:MAG: GT4 family glycosyltransferase PelF, partial [Zoogloea sp.]|nr:GT4 family glycosyltransferase PelF [Zoogloea sp.]